MAVLAGLSVFRTAYAWQPPLRHYTSDEGLVNNEVITGFQDSRGYLWFGTYSGLSRFNGKHFKNYHDYTNGIGGDVIRDIAQDAEGHIWVGYSGGISRLDPDTGRFVNYTGKDGLLGNDVVNLQSAPGKGLWILTEQGINHFDGRTFTTKPLDGIVTSLVGTKLQVSPAGDVFVVAGNRLLKKKPGHQLSFEPCPQVTFPVNNG